MNDGRERENRAQKYEWEGQLHDPFWRQFSGEASFPLKNGATRQSFL
jgi:hypothetical protein